MKKLVVLLTTVFMVACQSTDLFDEQAKERDIKAQYAANFSKSYPDVTLNQNWDYSKGPYKEYIIEIAKRLSKAGYAETEINVVYDGNGLYFEYNSFTIVPIFQGQASSVWELHAVIGGVDFKVWEKCQDVWVKKNENSDWQTVSSLSNTELYKNTQDVYAVRANTYTFNNVPAGVEMYFYLTVTKVTNSKYNYTVNSQMSSLNGMMLALKDCPRPANIAEDNEVMIIGCEDVYDEGSVKSDNDMNDVVFMVYGKPEVPSTIEITEDMSIEKKVTVRYMIEDLGSTDDFDFNDIVVDVSDVWTSSPVFTNGVLSGWTDSDKHQEAIVRHLGGILPFKLIIGSTELEEHAGVLGSNPDEEFVVSGWNKDQHNINVMVKQSTNSEVYNNVTFPKAGEAPMIIAVEPTQNWMKERVSVPSDWFYIPD